MPFKSDRQRKAAFTKMHSIAEGVGLGAGIFLMLAAAALSGKRHPIPGAPSAKRGPNFDTMKRVGSSSAVGYTNRMAKSRGKNAGALVLRRR